MENMMEGSLFVLLSGALTFGVPLLIGAHELLTTKPGGGGGGGRHDPVPEIVPPAPTPSLGDAPPPRKLPDCLIPNLPPLPATTRARELEPA
jgi:hypothetical protein